MTSRGRLRTAATLFGPAFVASVAYVDPGNFATNFAAGAAHGYRLLWVILLANGCAILVQYATAKLGLATGQNLPEICAQRYSRRTNMLLWAQAEIVAMSTDVAEFVGAALGLHLLFGIALLPAGLITAIVAVGLLDLERRGYRRFEVGIAGLLSLVALGFGYLVIATGSYDLRSLVAGVVPRLHGLSEVNLSVAIVGATIMPHVVYLHSDLQTNRIVARTESERQTLLRHSRWDCIVGLGLAGAVNVCMLMVAASLAHGMPRTGDLVSIHGVLGAAVGPGAAMAFAIALVASGFSSATVGARAGQTVMAGFIGRRIPVWIRRVVTMLPGLLILGLTSDLSGALITSQVVLAFGVPFALLPLVRITLDPDIMRTMTNTRSTTRLLVGITVMVTALNGYLLVTTLHLVG